MDFSFRELFRRIIASRIRLLIVGVYIALTAVLLSWHQHVELPPIDSEAKVWQYPDLKAPMDFEVYDDHATKRPAIDSAAAVMQLNFEKNDSIPLLVKRALDSLGARYTKEQRDFLEILHKFTYRYGYVDITLPSDLNGPAVLRKSRYAEEEVPIASLVDSVRLRRWLETNHQRHLVLWPVIREILRPNCFYNPAILQERILLGSPLQDYPELIQEGQVIIRRGELITDEKAKQLKALAQALEYSRSFTRQAISFSGLFLLIALITLISLIYLHISQHLTPENNRSLALILSIYLFITALAVVILKAEKYFQLTELTAYHLIPFAIGPMLLAIFFDDRVGFISALTLAAQISLLVRDPVEFFLVHGLSSMLTVFPLRAIQRRSYIFKAFLLLALGYTISYLGYHWSRVGSWQIAWNSLPLLYVNAAVCLSTYPLAYIFERIFGVSSDIAFLELLNTNHPLLKELATRAPGTYQHSMAVAILAEAAARHIGAHPLKVHVMGLFHDVGKIKNPSFFIENLAVITQGSAENPHFYLAPKESAQIIRSHVEDGVQLARRYGLPEEVIAGIRTHHGTSLIAYFWAKHQKQYPQDTDDMPFRYAGPRPRTKEEAILMLADTLEASTRAIPHLTPEKLRLHVRKMIQQRIAEGQLSHTPLTLMQLHELEDIFYHQLLSIHHARIEYPQTAETLRA